MKRLLVITGALVLGGCFHREDTRTPAPLTGLMAESSAPWLIVAAGADTLKVHGAKPSVELAPTPALSEALQAQLRSLVQGAYRTNLTVACTRPEFQMKANDSDTPDTAELKVAVHCTINAAGFVSQHDYQAAPTVKVADGSDGSAYAAALVSLMQQAGQSIGTQMAANVTSSWQP